MGSISLLRRGLWLEYATLGWNVIGTVIVLIAAVRAGSAALAGFGLDSAIEIFASVVVVWQLKGLEQGRESGTQTHRYCFHRAGDLCLRAIRLDAVSQCLSRTFTTRDRLARGDMRRHAAVGVGEVGHRPSAWQFGAYHGGPRHPD